MTAPRSSASTTSSAGSTVRECGPGTRKAGSRCSCMRTATFRSAPWHRPTRRWTSALSCWARSSPGTRPLVHRPILRNGEDPMIDLSRSRRLLVVLSLLAAVTIASGCAKDKVRYGDARGVETVTNEFGSTDLQMIAESMTRSMLGAPVVAGGNLPIVTVQEVKNKTSEYIDTRAITDSIRSELQKSQYYDPSKSSEVGKMVGAAYRLEGNITSIVKQVKDVKDVYYKFNLQLWNVRNGLLEWTDEKEIRKTTTKG